jgi:redox-sensing transcriptional repressor
MSRNSSYIASEKTVSRLSLYRRLLSLFKAEGRNEIYSYQLAEIVKVTPAQVRRDLMVLGYNGMPKRGYEVTKLTMYIDEFFNVSKNIEIILVGVGNIGRAMLSYFKKGKTYINIVASFDSDISKINKLINGCYCYDIKKLPKFLKTKKITTAILTVPVSQAQNTTDLLIENGITGLLNFSPARLKVPEKVYVEDVDITMHLEKAAYFSNILI